MFAFAIADRRRQELFVARDRFGEKPFLYAEDPDGVAFASEMKVLAAWPQLRREVNEDALSAYLCLNYVPGEDTMLRAVRRLRPGTWRLWTAAGSVRTAAYWQPPDPRQPDLDVPLPEALERLETLLDESARLALRMDGDVRIRLGEFLRRIVDGECSLHIGITGGGIRTGHRIVTPRGFPWCRRAPRPGSRNRAPRRRDAAGASTSAVDRTLPSPHRCLATPRLRPTCQSGDRCGQGVSHD
jgi:hypothetical protein